MARSHPALVDVYARLLLGSLTELMFYVTRRGDAPAAQHTAEAVIDDYLRRLLSDHDQPTKPTAPPQTPMSLRRRGAGSRRRAVSSAAVGARKE